MRLGLIRFKYDQAGGAERSFGLLAQGLTAKGHEVHVITTRWEGDLPAGVSLHLLSSATGASFPPRKFARAARAQAGLLKLDTFLSLDRVPGSPLFRAGDGCHAAWLARRARYEPFFKRLSFKLRPFHRALLDLEKKTFQAPELIKVMANSKMVAGEIKELYGLGPERVEVIYNGVTKDPASWAGRPETRERLRREMGLGQEAPVFLFLGSGFERKGLAFALKALIHLPEAVLWVAGRDRPGRYQRLSRHLGVAPRVRFLGARTDAPELMAAADALLLPTIYDPCSNACLEALAGGLPVVTTQGNGAAELVEERVSGWVVAEPADEYTLAKSCVRALGLKRPFPCRVPGLDQWLNQTIGLMEQAAGAEKCGSTGGRP